MRKKIFFLAVFLFMGMAAMFAQVASNQQLSYQAVVRNASNQLLINQSGISVVVNIKCDGTIVYSEEHTGLQTNENGLISLYIGSVAPTTGTWEDITWNNASIQTVTTWSDGTVTSDYVPVTAVPFALQAGNVQAQEQADWNETDNTSITFIKNKPTIPTTVAELTDAADYATVAKVQQDSNTLHNALIDTAAAIRGNFPVVNNGTLTIQTNGTDIGTFTADQSTNVTINIDVPAAQVQSNWAETDNTNAAFIQNKPDLSVYAIKADDNTFTGANDFTAGSVTVPNGISDLNVTLSAPCTQDAVNVCDLVALFDSLNKRIADLEEILDAVVDNLPTPTITTSPIMGVTTTEAIIGGNLVSTGQSTISERGLCYNTTGTPVISDTKIVAAGTNTGEYSHNLTGIQANTTYYVRAYVTTSELDTYYGEELSFTTLAPELTVVADTTSPLSMCGTGIDITFTASMTNDELTNYTLAWFIDDVEQTGETSSEFTHHFGETTNSVVKCVATRTGATAEGSADMDITVYTAPAMTLTRLEGNAGEDFGKVEISDVHCVASAEWVYNSEVIGDWMSEKTPILPIGDYTVNITGTPGCGNATQNITIRTSPVCIPQTAISSTLETTYELAGKQYVKTIKDHENNEYNVVQIGSTCWTRENMRAVTSPTTGSYLLDGASSVYQSKSATWPNLDSATFAPKNYGVLYNWCAAADVYHSSYPEIAEASESSVQVVLPHPSTNHRGICPEGWHLPVNQDFINFNTMFPKGGQWATGTDWQSGTATGPGDMSYEERNISGFSALPAGTRTSATNYLYQTAWFWTATEYSATQNWRHVLVYIYNGQAAITGSWNTSWTGIGQFNHQRLSIRCIRNNE